MLPGIGIFGTGNIVRVLVTFLREKGFKIISIWGRTKEEAERVATDMDIPFYTSKVDDVVLRKDIDLIFIFCAPKLHVEITVKALGLGKHVVCDKPGGLSQIDVFKMGKAALYYPTLITIINHSLRFLPAFVNLKREIKDGLLDGKISVIDIRVQIGPILADGQCYNWLCDARMGGGVLTLVGSHIIDLITYLTNRKAFKVHALIRNFSTTTNLHKNGSIRSVSSPDFCSFQMELDGGILVTATLSSYPNAIANQEITIFGPNGRLTVRSTDLFCCTGQQEEIRLLDTEKKQEPILTNEIFISGPYVQGLRNMIGALREAFEPVEDKSGWTKEPVSKAATFEDGVYVQSVIEALIQSNSNRDWTKVEQIADLPDPNSVLSSAAVRSKTISL
ncbi:unnamed protein product [Trichogramma brassicae]|uniref:Gfo/Idh/MocA-like oxidoreductase N-terminal domain-containing protein n=1 Tax=Trichogramma brassicae TaxID=86971 RepID=A0A6H5IMA3_9HYME|nr:unnamed protein product [Trichogramma brassicae]